MEKFPAHKWTKKEIKSFCQALDSYWLTRRPLGMFVPTGAFEAAAEHVRTELAHVPFRRERVADSVRGALHRACERYRSSIECVGNEIARFNKTLDDEMVRRFVDDAREQDAERKHCEALLRRVLDEDLPEEVLAYDPTTPKR